MNDQLKFDANAYQNSDVPTDLSQVENQLEAAIANQIQDTAGVGGSKFFSGGSSSTADTAIVDAIAAKGPAGVAVAAYAMQTDSSKKPEQSQFLMMGNGKRGGRSSSFFIGHITPSSVQFSNGAGGMAIMPMSYSEKKEAGKAAIKAGGATGRSGAQVGLVERSNISSMSLTGESATGAGKIVPIKGVKISMQQLKALGVSNDLVQSLEAVRFQKAHGTMSMANITHGLGRGDAHVEQWVQSNSATTVVQNIDKKYQTNIGMSHT